MSDPLLSITDFYLSLNNTPILHGINLRIDQGQSYALVGESGSGKSVMAHAIMQLFPPEICHHQGQILLDNTSLTQMSPEEMQHMRGKKIGIIFQNPVSSLNPTMSIGNQIAESIRFHDGLSKKQARVRTIELLHLVGIADGESRYDAYPFQISGGMCQRVMIAMAIAPSPRLLIADEPTTALDATVQAQILNLLQKIRSETGMSLLLITHDLSIVAGNCDHVAVMQKGRIVETASTETLFSSPQNPYTQSLLNARLDNHDLWRRSE